MRIAAIATALALAATAVAAPPVQIEWSSGPEMPNPTAGGATGIIGDELIVAGGTFWHTMQSKRYVPWTQIYDITQGRWRLGPDLPSERAYAFSTVIGDALYALGGCGQDGEPRSDGFVLVQREKADYAWEHGPDLPVAANFQTGGVIGATIYCTGGANADLSETYNAVYALDTRDHDAQWRELAAMPGPPVTLMAGATCGGDLFVFGGYRVDTDPPDNTDNAWRYVVAEDRWERIRDLPFGARALSALALDERRLLIFGPYVQSTRDAAVHGQEHGHSAAVLLYDIEQDRYYPLNPMPHCVVQIFFGLHDGTVYGAGGEWLYKIRSPFLFIGDLIRS